MEKRLLSIVELGEYLGIKTQTIRNRLSNGTFPIRALKVCGRIKFDIKDVEKYLARAKSGSGNAFDSQQGLCDT